MTHPDHRESKQYPELMHFPTREEADQALHAWNKRLMKTPRLWLAMLGYTCAVGITVSLILISLRSWIHVPPGMYGGIIGGVTGGSGIFVLAWFWRKRCRCFLRQELIARGIPICLECGYDLRGQTQPRCPECGTAFDADLIDRSSSKPGSTKSEDAV